jgi:hypothetical protein
MALTDFYVSDSNGYKGSIPIDLNQVDTVTSGWLVVDGKPNVWQMYFPTYAPKIVSERYSTRTLYGKPYTKALDLQSLDQMIHGGFFYDVITKKLYVKCFNLAVPNQKSINISNLQSIEARINSYYIHQNLKLGSNSGIKFSATVGIGDYYVDGVNLKNQNEFYFSFFVIDPEPTPPEEVLFPTLAPYTLDGMKCPGIHIKYFINNTVEYLNTLINTPLTTIRDGDYRYVLENRSVYRYEATANEGDAKPASSNGTGVGTGNGWWIKVYGLTLEQVINETPDIATLKNLGCGVGTGGWLYPDQLMKVVNNDKIYKYVASASAGTLKPNCSDGTGNSTYANHWLNGWWIEVEPTDLGDLSGIVTTNHCALKLSLNSNTLQISAHAIQPFTAHVQQLETLQKGSFKVELEMFPRTGSVMILDYTIKIIQILDSDAQTEPQIYQGTIEGLPTTGNFQNYLVGFGLAHHVLVDDFIVSEIIESV